MGKYVSMYVYDIISILLLISRLTARQLCCPQTLKCRMWKCIMLLFFVMDVMVTLSIQNNVYSQRQSECHKTQILTGLILTSWTRYCTKSGKYSPVDIYQCKNTMQSFVLTNQSKCNYLFVISHYVCWIQCNWSFTLDSAREL